MTRALRSPPSVSRSGERRRRTGGALLATLLLTVTHLPGVMVLAAPQMFARVGPGVSGLPLQATAFDDASFGEINDAINVATGSAYMDLGKINRNNSDSKALSNSGTTLGGSAGTSSAVSGSFNVTGLPRLNGFSTYNPAQPQEWSLGLGDGSNQLYQRVAPTGTTAQCVDNRSEVVGISKVLTGTGTTEVHALRGSDNFQTFADQQGSVMPYDPTHVYFMADWDRDGRPDLVKIKRDNTATGKTEVHIASGASAFKTWIVNTGTALGMTNTLWNFQMTDWNNDGRLDLVAMPKRNTGTYGVEVHILNGADNFQTFLQQSVTRMPPQPDYSSLYFADWNRDGRPDLIAVQREQNASGRVEVHIVSGASNYTVSLLDAVTGLGNVGPNWDFDVFDWNKDGFLDLVSVAKNGTNIQKTEVHIMSGATQFQSFLAQTGTALGQVPNNEWSFVAADFSAACTAPTYPLAEAPSWIKDRYEGLGSSVAYYVTKPQVSVQIDEQWLVTYRLPNGRTIAHAYDHSGNRTTFYNDGEYADYAQTPHEQYRAAKYQSDLDGTGAAAPKTEFTYTGVGNGRLRKVKDSWNRVTTYSWDEGQGIITGVNMLLKNENDDNSWMRRVDYAYEVVGNQRLVSYLAFRTEDGRGNRIGRWFDLNYRTGTNGEVLLYQVGRPLLNMASDGTLGSYGGKFTTYTYDAQNRVIRTSTPGEPDTTLSYGQSSADTGAGGPRVVQTQGDKITVYEFSPEGWLRNRSVRNFNALTGQDNNPVNSIWNGINTMSWYDADGHITAQSQPSGSQLQFTYDRHGNLKTEAIYGAAVNWAAEPPAGYERLTRYEYDQDNRLTKQTQVARSGAAKAGPTVASDASYTYGAVEKRYSYLLHDAYQVNWGKVTATKMVGEDLYVAGTLKRQFETGVDVYGRTTNTVLRIGGTPYRTVDYTYYTEGATAGLVYPSSMTTPNTDGRTYDRERSVRLYADQVASKTSNGVRTDYLYDEYGHMVREVVVNNHTSGWEATVAKTS